MNTSAKNKTLKVLSEKVGIIVKSGSSMAWDKMCEWQKGANSYRITLIYQGKRYSLDFWQGIGIKTDPTAKSVLECLLSDVSCSQHSFEDFCNNCGYDTDSRKAEKIYKQCQAQEIRLKKLLGNDFQTFLEAYKEG